MDIITNSQIVFYKRQKDTSNMSFNQNESNKGYNSDVLSLMVAPGTQGVYVYVLKKLEKIVSAIFLVTDLFSEKDSLRYKLRDVSLELLSVAAHDQSLETIKPYLVEFLSLLDVAYHGNQLSEMNYTVLKRELSDLIDRIQKDKYETFSLPRSFFDTPEQQGRPIEQKTESKTVNLPQPLQTKIKQVNKGQADHSPKKTSSKKAARQQRILDIVKDMKKVSVTDVSAKIPNVSDKTIQRELIALVESGILKKEGERRWSTYSLL